MDIIIAQASGAPDIQGYIRAVYTWTPEQRSGAFTVAKLSTTGVANSGTNVDTAPYGVTFKASDSNKIYGRYGNITPLAITIRYWKRLQ